ncbi:hypothetical protein CEXT_583951 [Caerostris extrusa]|uniref:Uncharacterized protein n=1 Tax=Caerostris extrusa TaxID=172846 RepID=A0AAV4RZI0_CAEEX|nr:hypothetical protein CEXT_583951 [Caerostris extrusa]
MDVIKSMHAIHSAAIDDQECLYESRKENWMHSPDKSSKFHSINVNLTSLYDKHSEEQLSQCQAMNIISESLLTIHTKDEASQCQEMNTELPSLLAIHTKDEASQCQEMNTILPSSLTTHTESVELQNRKMDKIIPSLQGATSADECPAINMQNVPLFVKLAIISLSGCRILLKIRMKYTNVSHMLPQIESSCVEDTKVQFDEDVLALNYLKLVIVVCR